MSKSLTFAAPAMPHKSAARARWTAAALLSCAFVFAAPNSGASDTSASSLAATPAEADHTAPASVSHLISSRPANNAVDVALGTAIELHFAQQRRADALSGVAYTLIGPAGPVAVDEQTNAARGDVSIKPREDLLPATRYTLFVSPPTASSASAALQSITFTTAVIGRDAASAASANGASIRVSTGDNASAPERCDSTHDLRGYRFCHDAGAVVGGVFTPGFNNTGGRWRTNVPLPDLPTVADFPPATFAAGATAVFGVVRRIDDAPVANVSVSLGDLHARTDANGRFVLNDAPEGHQVLFVDGSSANSGDAEFGQFEIAVELKAHEANRVPFNMYLPRIAARDKVQLSSPTLRDTVVTHPGIPGFELRIPAGTVLRDRNGKVITQLSIVPMPVDRSPAPVPENFLVHVSLQPGEAFVEGLNTAAGAGLETIYPNYGSTDEQPGKGLWYYDAERSGWERYSDSTVASNGRTIQPTSSWGAKRLMPKGGPPSVGGPGAGPPPKGCPTCSPMNGGDPPPVKADPVDLATGIFFRQTTDLALHDPAPLSFTRFYNSQDTANRSFGRGANNGFGMYLYSPAGSCVAADTHAGSEIDLVAPDGVFPFFTSNAPTIYNSYGAVLTHTGTPSRFYGAIMYAVVAKSFVVQLRDGTTYTFQGASCPSNLLSASDRFGNATTMIYNAGLLAQVESTSGRWLKFTYNANNQISSVTDNAGRSVGYTYTGNLLTKATYPDTTTEQYAYDAAGNMTTITDRRGNVALTNHYDANNRVSYQTFPDNTQNLFTYTLSGNQVTATNYTDTRGNVLRYTFDAAGYASSMTKAYGTSLAQTTTYVRGQDELVTSKTDALGRVTTFSFSSRGDILGQTFLYGTANVVSYGYSYTSDFHQVASLTDPLNHTIVFGYTNGCLTSVSDGLGHATALTCSADGQVLTVTDPLSHVTTLTYLGSDLRSVTDPLGHTRTVSSDSLGRAIAGVDPMGRERRSVYDVNDMVTSTFDALNQQAIYAYDGNGNLVSVTDPNGAVTRYGYDARNHRTSRTDALNQVESWTYDGEGNVLTYTDRKNQLTQYQYDALNRLSMTSYADGTTVVATYDAGNRLVQLVDSLSGTIVRSYDGLDNLTQEQTPQGTVTYTYDAANRRATMTPANQTQITYTYDNADRLTSIVQGTQTVAIAYDNADRRTQMTLPNGVVTTYAYDNANELTGLTYQTSGGTTLGTLAYSYDAAGFRISQNGGFGADQLPTSTTGANQFDLNNRQSQWNGFSLSYDTNGDLQTTPYRSPLGWYGYVWDARHRLIEIDDYAHHLQGQSYSVVAQFTYDALNRRTSKTIGGATTNFLYDRQNTVQEIHGATTATMLTGFGIDELFARDDAAYGRTYFLTDAMGSTVGLVDSTQAVRQIYSYEAYGETTATGSSDNPYQYTERENDSLGLYYYRARYYSPSLKRFISEDPMGLTAGLNEYAYVHDQPIQRRDPLGLDDTVCMWDPSLCANARPPAPHRDCSGQDPGIGCKDVLPIVFGAACARVPLAGAACALGGLLIGKALDNMCGLGTILSDPPPQAFPLQSPSTPPN